MDSFTERCEFSFFFLVEFLEYDLSACESLYILNMCILTTAVYK